MGDCANHEGVAAVVHCRGCRLGLCDGCCVYSINDDAWCEACGSAIEEEARPKALRGVVIGGIGAAVTTVVMVARYVFIPASIPGFLFVVMLGYAGSIFLGWNTVSPIMGVERPRVVRRQPGSPLPRHARRA